MNTAEQIIDLLKKENLTIKELVQKTGIKDTAIRSCIAKLKVEGKVKEAGKKGRAINYSISKGNEIIADYLILIENPKFIDALIFSYVSSYNKPSYGKIQGFLSSLGITEKNILTAIIRNIARKQLEIENIPEGNFARVLNVLIKNGDNINKLYPLTMTFQEAYQFLEELGIQNIQEFITLMLNLSKRYPEFVVPSTSRIGQNFDLISFKQIFIEQIKFKLSGAWSVS